MYLLGSTGQCIAVFMYLVKYIAKDANFLSDSISVIAKARAYLEEHPTVARENETQDIRNVKKFCQRVINSCEGGSREMADTTVAYANIGGTGHIVSHAFCYLFAYDTVQAFVSNFAPDGHVHITEEFLHGNIPVYTTSTGVKIAVSQANLYLHRVHPNYTRKRIVILNDAYAELIRVMDDRNASEEYVQEKILCHKLALYFYHNNLASMSMREYASIVKLIPMNREERQQLLIEMNEPTVAMWGPARTRTQGREASARFLLHPDHPLYDTHCHTLRAKHRVAIMAGGKPPVYPTTLPAEGEGPNIALQNKRDSFASYVIANYWPYTKDSPPTIPSYRSGPEDLNISLDWNGLSKLLDYLYHPSASFIARGRQFEITNLAFGSREHPDFGASIKKLITKYRYSNADNLLDPNKLNPFGRPSRRTGSGNNYDEPEIDQQARREAEAIYNSNRLSEQDETAMVALDAKRKQFQVDFIHLTTNHFGSVEVRLNNMNNSRVNQQEIGGTLASNNITQDDLTALLGRIKSTDTTYVAPTETMDVSESVLLPTAPVLPIPMQVTSTASEQAAANIMDMSDDQIEIVRRCLNMGPADNLEKEQFALAYQVIMRIQGNLTEPLRIVFEGGPGTGKTYTVSLVQKADPTRPWLYTAVWGSAASNLPSGKTICNAFGMVPRKPFHNPGQLTRQNTLLSANKQKKYDDLSLIFEEKDGFLLIDEMSVMTALYLAHLEHRMQELPHDEIKRASSWGGYNVILTGDWFQIPAVGGVSIPTAIYRTLVDEDSIKLPQDELIVEAARSFMKFKRMRLKTNMRAAADQAHVDRIRRMSDTNELHPISHELTTFLRSIVLTGDTMLAEDGKWQKHGVCLTASNVERCIINNYRGNLYAQLTGEVMISWPLKAVGNAAASLSNEEQRLLLDNYAELSGYFIKGAPCALTENLKPEKGLANGTQAIMNSLLFDSNDPLYQETKELIISAAPGSHVRVPIRPTHVIVEYLPRWNIELVPDERIPVLVATPIDPDYTCVAITTKVSHSSSNTLNTVVIGDKVIKDYKYLEASVDLGFAFTFEKAQGKTIPLVIICLHTNLWKNAGLAHLYVAFTRVKEGCHLRVWPSNNLELERFEKLEHDKYILLLNKAYRDDGTFSEDLYRAAYNEYIVSHVGGGGGRGRGGRGRGGGGGGRGRGGRGGRVRGGGGGRGRGGRDVSSRGQVVPVTENTGAPTRAIGGRSGGRRGGRNRGIVGTAGPPVVSETLNNSSISTSILTTVAPNLAIDRPSSFVQTTDTVPISRRRERDSSSALQIDRNPAAHARPRVENLTVPQLRQNLINQPSNSMVFMPFLRKLFREGEIPTNCDEDILHLLPRFWEGGQLNFIQSIDSMRESYKVLGVYESIRAKYNMGPDTYIPASEQVCLLGQLDLHSGGLSNTAQTDPLFHRLSQINNEHTHNILLISQRLFATVTRIRNPTPGLALAEGLDIHH